MKHILVIGGGAAGMMAAITAARNGAKVSLYEKNEKLGKKIYITGKGRCNVCNGADIDTLFASILTNRRFLYSAFYTFDNQAVMRFFEELGVPLKEERGGRIFPVSDHAQDITNALAKEMKRLGVQVSLKSEVKEILTSATESEAVALRARSPKRQLADQTIATEGEGLTWARGIILSTGQAVQADAVIITTGGLSYPLTGSTGDGLRFAKALGHSVTPTFPALVPLTVGEPVCKELQGLSLRNVKIKIFEDDALHQTSHQKKTKILYEDFGEMLFTHFGVSGPLILSASSVVGEMLTKKGDLTLSIDFKPALDESTLDARLVRDFSENPNKQFKNALSKLFPAKLQPVMVRASGIDPHKAICEVTKEERLAFVRLIKDFRLTLLGLRSYKEAIITKGGVNVKEVDPSTMASKLVPGLYFAGEVLDLDAVTGGFNFQIAWSTGYLAGLSASEQ